MRRKGERQSSASWLIPSRHSDPELMDQPGLPEAEVAGAYAVLCRVNRQLGNNWSIAREAQSFGVEAARSKSRRWVVVDVGSGSGDIAARLKRKLASFAPSAVAVEVLALDRDMTATRLASKAGVPTLQADALRLPIADESIDLVTAVKFAHHFEGPALSRLLSEMARVARRRVVVLDIRRHWLAYWGFVAWSRVLTHNRLVRHDGPVSVLRGFTPDELLDAVAPIEGFTWTIRRYLGFQLVLVGQRIESASQFAPNASALKLPSTFGPSSTNERL